MSDNEPQDDQSPTTKVDGYGADNTALADVVEALKELMNEKSISKNVKSKLTAMIEDLSNSEDDTSLKINKVLNELDEINETCDLQPFIRTQLWNISSMLEMVQ